MSKRKRDDKLQASVGIYQDLMEDFAKLADIFIGNETIEDFNEAGEYIPLLRLVADFHLEVCRSLDPTHYHGRSSHCDHVR